MSAPHALIIGGGPAGCAAAIGLLRRGFRVTIVEKAAFPRVKVCGEFVSPAATEILERLIPAEALRDAGARRADRVALAVRTGGVDREAVWAAPASAWALSRATLDDLLLGRAKAAGAAVAQPCAVRGVEYGAGGCVASLDSGGTIGADFVLHADGSGRLDRSGPTPMRRGVIGLKCHFTGAGDLEGVAMRAARGAYIGTIAVEGGVRTCALTARADLVRRFGGDHDAMLASLWPAWRDAERSTPWLACGVGASGYIAPGHGRSFRIGNAAAAVEPVGGEGIGLALWAGATLAEMMEPSRIGETQRRFAAAYRSRLRWRRPVCRLSAGALMRPALVAAGLRIARPSLALAPWWALTGKPGAA